EDLHRPDSVRKARAALCKPAGGHGAALALRRPDALSKRASRASRHDRVDPDGQRLDGSRVTRATRVNGRCAGSDSGARALPTWKEQFAKCPVGFSRSNGTAPSRSSPPILTWTLKGRRCTTRPSSTKTAYST